MIIDIHTHAWPEKISGKAREFLESLFHVQMVGDPTVTTLLHAMDKCGIDLSVICGVAARPEQVPSINNWLFSVRSERLKVFCALHPAYEKWTEEISRIADQGDGVKLQPEFQNFYVDSEAVFPLYERLERDQIPVLFHCGEELSGTMLVRSSPERILAVKEKFPHLCIIAAHFGGFRLWKDVKKYLLGKDIYLDTSFFFPYLSPDEIISFLTSHPDDRLLFGTDFPLVDQKEDIRFLENLDISTSLRRKIFSENAQRLLDFSKKRKA